MNKKWLVNLAIGAACTAGSALVMSQCNSPDVVYRETVVHDTLSLPPDTVRAPGQTLIKLVHAAPLAHQNNNAMIADLHAELDSLYGEIAQYAEVTARARVVVDRHAIILRGEDTTTVPFTDEVTAEYSFPPVNEFTLIHQEAKISLPPDTTTQVFVSQTPVNTPLPDWLYYTLEAIKVGAGIVIGLYSK